MGRSKTVERMARELAGLTGDDAWWRHEESAREMLEWGYGTTREGAMGERERGEDLNRLADEWEEKARALRPSPGFSDETEREEGWRRGRQEALEICAEQLRRLLRTAPEPTPEEREGGERPRLPKGTGDEVQDARIVMDSVKDYFSERAGNDELAADLLLMIEEFVMPILRPTPEGEPEDLCPFCERMLEPEAREFLRDYLERKTEGEPVGESLRRVKEIIEQGDQRLTAQDGSAGGQPPALTLEEWREIYERVCRAIPEEGSDETDTGEVDHCMGGRGSFAGSVDGRGGVPEVVEGYAYSDGPKKTIFWHRDERKYHNERSATLVYRHPRTDRPEGGEDD